MGHSKIWDAATWPLEGQFIVVNAYTGKDKN